MGSIAVSDKAIFLSGCKEQAPRLYYIESLIYTKVRVKNEVNYKSNEGIDYIN